MEDFIKAGKIAKEVREYSKTIVKPGIKLIDLADKIEKKISELGAKSAFPVNLSLNSVAAHYTPKENDETVFEKDDILKIDVGVHVNGYIGDTAVTVGNNKELINASQDALKAATKIVNIGTELREIGKEINDAITSHGFQPIVNLSGHGLDKFVIHTSPSVPNYDNGDTTQLKDGDTIAIEPFATDGKGKVGEGGPSSIYKLNEIKPIRDMTARKVLKFIQEEYNTLPFAERWITKKFPKGKFALLSLARSGIVKEYAQLPETSKGLVSQAEHSYLIKEKTIVTTI
ncbi:MAG: type II methionyl aminopeptidase [archaeon]